MATMLATHYTPLAYDTLPDLGTAQERYDLADLRSIIRGPIQDLVIKHKMCARYGIILLHRHFAMEPNERLVERGDVSTPWSDGGNDTISFTRYGGRVAPRTFRLLDGEFVPYEFAFEPGTTGAVEPADEKEEAFLREMADVLVKHGVEGDLGLRMLDDLHPKCFIETQEGRANIMLPAHDMEPKWESVEVVWRFEEGIRKHGDCIMQFTCLSDKSTKPPSHNCIYVGHRRA